MKWNALFCTFAVLLGTAVGCHDDGAPIPPDKCTILPLPACIDTAHITYNRTYDQCVYRLDPLATDCECVEGDVKVCMLEGRRGVQRCEKSGESGTAWTPACNALTDVPLSPTDDSFGVIKPYTAP